MSIVPVVDDHDTAGFFAAAEHGRLAVCRCGQCAAVLHMPVNHCRYCGADDPQWQPVAPTGRIYSYTVVTHQVHPEFPVPYTVVLIELDELAEVRLAGHLDGRPKVYIGQAVTAEFRPLPGGSAIPEWRLS